MDDNGVFKIPHVPQQDEASGELLVAGVALEGLLPGVVPHVVVKNVPPVESLCAIGTLELLLLHVGLDVSL
jgi:hypothetical protein